MNARSSCPEAFCKKAFFRNFAKFTGKHLCQRLFFNKVAGLRSATLLKNSLWHRSFLVNFAKFLITPLFTEHLQWLLLEKIELQKKVQRRIFVRHITFLTTLSPSYVIFVGFFVYSVLSIYSNFTYKRKREEILF